MAANTIYWHDYEAFGSDPRYDRPCQFAGVRTDEDLNVIGTPLTLYCRPPADYLPDPEACLITGIGPGLARREGLSEAEFCAAIHAEFSVPGTCGAGYNSIRFDDELTRHLFYRCFRDPYEREWRNGNSRWDIIDMLRLAWAVRPDGIRWPRKDDGSPSFRLEDLTRENGIAHAGAHDALADVQATIELARLVKRAQRRLYDWYYRHRHKSAILPLLDPARREPLLHVSSRYAAARGCLAVIIPLARHPVNQNGVIVADLGVDPGAWLGLGAEQLRERLFAPPAALAEGEERPPLKVVHANKCPVLAPLSVLTDDVQARWRIDLAACRVHLEIIEAAQGLQERLRAAYAEPAREGESDPDLLLYGGGFFDDGDRELMAWVRELPAAELGSRRLDFRDPRLPEMLARYRARNYPETLSDSEREGWRAHCRRCLEEGPRPWAQYHERLAALRAERPEAAALFDDLAAHACELGRHAGLLPDDEAARC